MIRIACAGFFLLFLISCAPRFTVYVDPWVVMNKQGVTVLSTDTVTTTGSQKIKRVRYVLTRDIKGIEKIFLRSKLK